jgi:hypothetical protein
MVPRRQPERSVDQSTNWGEGMSRIFWIILIICVVIGAAFWAANRSKTHAINSGEVFVQQPAGDKTKLEPSTSERATTREPAPSVETPPQAASNSEPVAPPAIASIQRNPPNGMIFAGTGKYQLYRQGDLTWRLNTETGQGCILFATDTEWRKPKVFQHGCGS